MNLTMFLNSDGNSIALEAFGEYISVCGEEKNDPNAIHKIKSELQIKNDIPIVLTGILLDLNHKTPNLYWSRQVMLEVSKKLLSLYRNNNGRFYKVFSENQDLFFLAINNYLEIIDTFNELEDVAYDAEVKTKFFRNQIYVRICEECLMKFYKFILKILNAHSEKNYSNVSTLNQAIEILKKNDFLTTADVDVNLRNAINHGNVMCNGSSGHWCLKRTQLKY